MRNLHAKRMSHTHTHSKLGAHMILQTQSQEKIDLLRMLGAEVYPVPAVAFENPQNYNHRQSSPS